MKTGTKARIPRKQRSKGDNQNQSDEKREEIARALTGQFGLSLFKYFSTLPGVVNCDSNLDGDSVPFFVFNNLNGKWFGNTICFDFKTTSFRIYIACQVDTSINTVNEDMQLAWPAGAEPKHLYKYVTNYWVQFNLSKTHEPHDESSRFLFRVDADRRHKKVEIYPHHKHYYYNNKSLQATEFSGTRDDLLDLLQDALENETLSDE